MLIDILPRPAAAVPAIAALLFGLSPLVGAAAATPADLLAAHQAAAGAPGVAARGQTLFTTPNAARLSCASCHGTVPTQAGRHASTGKAIDPLAPAFNPQRLTDPAKVEKWFRRNCNDVLARECTAGEKADVIAWLLTLKP